MARRYVRDNRGRFATTGATARGGRLRTASGNKRKAQTMKAATGEPRRGTIKRSTIKARRTEKPKVSSAREQAASRLKIKTATRRKLKTDRSSVIPAQPKARRIRAQRPASTVAKPRTKGNDPRTVARRVDRKAAVNQANIKNITQKERTGATQGRQYQRALKTQATLKRAQDFTRTGQLPGRDNSIRAQRERRAASQRLAAKNEARRRGDTASVNVPMRGSRGRRLDAEITRNVTQQRTAKRAESRARNAQFKSDQSRAKALRGKYGDQLAKDFAAKSGRKVSEVKATIKGMAPSQQVKLLTKAGREQRAQANLARSADNKNFRRNPKGYATRIAAQTAQKIYKTGDVTAGLSVRDMAGKGFRLPRSRR
tara:strand:+ start:277 stop:1386 length:1110 start_codon:yes stop_codon:yes gene_type:complete